MIESLDTSVELGVGYGQDALLELARLPITPLVENYTQVPLREGFNMEEILLMTSNMRSIPYGHHMWVVDFGSLLRPGANVDILIELDDKAHREAAASEGFGIYFRGDIDKQGFNRSFCVWKNSADAMAASGKEDHKKAMAIAKVVYQRYDVTMREAWLEPSTEGYAFGPETVHSHPQAEKRPLGRVAISHNTAI